MTNTTATGPYVRVPLLPHQLIERITPTTDLFVLAHLGVTQVRERDWSIEVDGLVRHPHRFTLADLQQMQKVAIETAHECCGNPLHPRVPERRIANVVWGGVALPTLLDLVGVAAAARFVWAYGLDRGTLGDFSVEAYIKDLPLTRVTAGDILVAYELNGAPLSAEHGFPARLLVPGWYGTNSVKWLRRIQLADRRAESPFTTVLYNDGPDSPVWAIAPESVIVSPAPDSRLHAGTEVDVWGWAWGDEPVEAVEVSVDGGATWRQADVERRQQRSWQRFQLAWRPDQPAPTRLLSRATTRGGATQPTQDARNAVHSIPVSVGQRYTGHAREERQ
jgi:sulfane dehydrogenase subunit SoxC